MNTLRLRRRPLGQRLVDAALTGVAFAIFFVPAWLLDREDRKATACRTGGVRP